MSTIPAPDNTKMTSSSQEDYVEDVVCKDSDVGENEIKAFDLLDHGKVLIIRQNGQLHAIGSKCTHYGAPLQNSVLGDGRIRCQWHGACFNIATGDIEDFPGLDSLPCYQVTVENDNVKVRAKKSEVQNNKRVKTMAVQDQKVTENIVVIGGGPAGAVCVETLRQEGFRGKITLVAKENYLPYERIKLTKAMDIDIIKAQLRSDEFYKGNGIEVLKGTKATKINTRDKTVTLDNGKLLPYDNLFVATGSTPRKPDMLGADLKNVVVIREYEHAAYVLSQLGPDKHVVILGSSFIGMETASYCVDKAEKVTVVSKDSVPFLAPFGPDVGLAVMKLFESKGVNFVINSGIKRCIDNQRDQIRSVELLDGTVLRADLCVMGVGSTLNTELFANSGVVVNSNGSIEVNQYLQTNVANVYAGGDIAHAPVWARKNQKAMIGHWGLAHYHGRIAALNILHKETPLKNVPYFWTMFFGKGIRYAGHGRYDDIIYSGDVSELKFAAFYLDDDEVVAVSSCQMDPTVSKYAEYVSQGKKLYRKDLEGNPLAWCN